MKKPKKPTDSTRATSSRRKTPNARGATASTKSEVERVAPTGAPKSVAVPNVAPSPLGVVANLLQRLRGSFLVLEYARQSGRESDLKSYREGQNFPIYEILPLHSYAGGILQELTEVYETRKAIHLQAEVTTLVADLLSWTSEREDIRKPEDASRVQELFERLERVGRECGSAAQVLAQRRRLTAVGLDGSWLVVKGVRYDFTKAQQAKVVLALHSERAKAGGIDGVGLHELVLGKLVGSNADTFRMHDVFKNHPAFGPVIRSTAKGLWALFLD